MKPYIYAFLFAVFLLFLKAFYFDSLSSGSKPDTNMTTTSSENITIKKEKKIINQPDNKVDKFFDEVGDSISNKIKEQE